MADWLLDSPKSNNYYDYAVMVITFLPNSDDPGDGSTVKASMKAK